MTRSPELFWGVVASMFIGNAMLVALNLPLVGIWVRLLTIPYRWLFPAIILFCALGNYNLNNSAIDVYLCAAVGILAMSSPTCNARRPRYPGLCTGADDVGKHPPRTPAVGRRSVDLREKPDQRDAAGYFGAFARQHDPARDPQEEGAGLRGGVSPEMSFGV